MIQWGTCIISVTLTLSPKYYCFIAGHLYNRDTLMWSQWYPLDYTRSTALHYMVVMCVCVVYSIFGYEGTEAENIFYVNWLNMVRAGLIGLEYYTPETKKWRQVSQCTVVTVVLIQYVIIMFTKAQLVN